MGPGSASLRRHGNPSTAWLGPELDTRLLVALFSFALGGCPVADEPARSRVEIDPAEGIAGTRVTVHVRGTNTHFDSPDFQLAIVGPDVRIVEERPDSATAARLVLDIDDDATAGPRTLVIVAAGERFEQVFQVRVVRGEAAVRLDPRVGTPGADVELRLDGTSTHFEQGATFLSFPEVSRVQVRSLVVDSPIEASARVHIDADAPGGVVAAAVTTRDEVVYDSFEVVTEAEPTLTADPSSGFAGHGVDVTISGPTVDFASPEGVVVVAFVDDPSIVVSNARVVTSSLIEARFTIPEGSPQGFRRFTVGVDLDEEPDGAMDETIASGPFYVRAPGAPSVSASPNFVLRGSEPFLWIEGHSTAFGPETRVRTVPGSGIAIAGLWIFGPEDMAVRLDVEPAALLGTTEITVDDGTTGTLSAMFEVLNLALPRASLAPGRIARGSRGTQIVISGTGTSFERGVTRASAEPGSGVFVSSLSVIDETSATVTVDVQPSAPEGETNLALETKGQTVVAPLTITSVAGEDPALLDPPVVRAGVGQVEVVATGERIDPDHADGSVVASDPSLLIVGVEDAEEDGLRMALDVGRAARAGSCVIVVGTGTERSAGRLSVLPAPGTIVTAAPQLLPAGTAGRLILLVGEGTSFIDGVTVAAGPPGRGISVDGLTVIDRTTAILGLTVLSDAAPGDAGILLATHGELAAARLVLTEATDVPSMSIEPAALEPDEHATLTVHGVGTDFLGSSTSVGFPGSREVLTATAARVLDAVTLEVDVVVEPDAAAATVPIRVQSGADVIMGALTISTPSAPTILMRPYTVRLGETATLTVEVEGMDLEAQPPGWFSDPVEGVEAVVRVVDSAHADVDVTVDAAQDGPSAIWFGLDSGGSTARQRVVVTPGPQAASTGGISIEAGSRSNDVLVTGTLTTFSPGETVAACGDDSSPFRFGEPVVGGPTQLSLPVDVSSSAEGPSRILLTTGPDLAVATIDVRRSAPAPFTAPGSVSGTVLADLSALLERADSDGGFLAMSAVADGDGPELRVGLIAPDGFARLALPIGSAIAYPAPIGSVARIELEPGLVPDGPVAFTFVAEPLGADAQAELEPNDTADVAEPIEEPTTSPSVVSGAIDPTAEADLFSFETEWPAVVEVWARRLSGGSASTPDLSIAILDADGETTATAIATLGEDPAILLEPGPATIRFEGLAGSIGPYLAVFRSAVVVGEVGWSGEGGFVELRAAPELSLDGYSLEMRDDAGRAIAEAVLGELAARSDGLLLLSDDGALLPDLGLGAMVPFDGTVTVLHEGEVVDAVAFGAAAPAEGDPALVGDEGAIARTLGIDRNDNAADFTPRTPSPGR